MLFRERLSVPLLWWLLAAGFALSMLAALAFSVGAVWGIAGAAVSLLVATWVFVRAGISIRIDSRAIRIGRAEIEHLYIGGCRPLDAEATRRRAGVEADARAHLVLRPYIDTAVEIALVDPADPVPYWLVSSRRPEKLAAALTAAIGPRTSESHAPLGRSKGDDPLEPPRA